MITSGPGGFGEESTEMAPPQPQAQPETISEGGRSFTVDDSTGLAIPTELVEARAEENVAQNRPKDEQILQPEAEDLSETGKEQKEVTQEALDKAARDKKKEEIRQLTPEQRIENIRDAIESLPESIKLASNITEAKEEIRKILVEQGASADVIEAQLLRTEDLFQEMGDSAEENIDELKNNGDITPQQAKEAKSELRKFFESRVVELGSFVKEGVKSSDSKTIFDLFLVFGTEGKYGDSGIGEFSRGVEKDSSDAYLFQILEKGGEAGLKGFIGAVLNKDSVGEIGDEEIKQLFSDMHAMMEMGSWDDIQDRLSLFLNKNEYLGKHTFSKEHIREMIDKMNGISADQIRKVFGIETSDEASEASDDQQTLGQSGTSQPTTQESAT